MTSHIPTIYDALNAFDREQFADHVQKGRQEREEMRQRFPRDIWPQMTLKEYALGQPDVPESYSWWLEFGTQHMGSMRGGTSSKHLVYKRKKKPGWYYRSQYSNREEAWEALRDGFVEMLALAEAGRWDEIDEVDAVRGARTLKLKSLHLYFPEEILPITSNGHIQHFLKRINVHKDEMKNWGAVRLNRHLLHALRDIPQLAGWSTDELGRLLYTWADPRQARRIVKIAPGERGKYWQDCLASGIICVGWDDVGDLREYESEAELREAFAERFGDQYNNHQSTITKKTKELWSLTELEPGDLIVANRGLSEILGVGEVVEPGYDWHLDRREYKHVVHVKWDTDYAKEIALPQYWANVTVAPIGLELSRALLTKSNRNEPPPVPLPVLYPQIANALERRGQVILYGPPGTGKTFHARRFAVWWLRQHLGDGAAAAVLTDSSQLKAAEASLQTRQVTRRVWWIVANPKEWSWDQLFTDGRVTYRYGRLQRNYPLVQPGDLVVGYQSTPDKRIMALAEVTRGISETDSSEPTIELKPLHRIDDGHTYAELREDEQLRKSEPMRLRCQGTLFALTNSEADTLLAQLSERNPDLPGFVAGEQTIGAMTWVTFHPSYSYEDFIEGFRPVDTGEGNLVLQMEDGLFKRICRQAQAFPQKKFLLLVDEINRANLAKVFGEIITLLERDKRGMTITLPQSKESFTIPTNVFLLGTMNTADRSIKLMDTALRRRFAFLEMMPDVSLLGGAAVNNLPLDELLMTLNQRITETEGREKQIGHAFLLDSEQPVSDPAEFARRFRQEILPLLREYCYDDYHALAQYLGSQLVDTQAQTLNTRVLQDDDQLIEALTAVLNDGDSA